MQNNIGCMVTFYSMVSLIDLSPPVLRLGFILEYSVGTPREVDNLFCIALGVVMSIYSFMWLHFC